MVSGFHVDTGSHSSSRQVEDPTAGNVSRSHHLGSVVAIPTYKEGQLIQNCQPLDAADYYVERRTIYEHTRDRRCPVNDDRTADRL